MKHTNNITSIDCFIPFILMWALSRSGAISKSNHELGTLCSLFRDALAIWMHLTMRRCCGKRIISCPLSTNYPGAHRQKRLRMRFRGNRAMIYAIFYNNFASLSMYYLRQLRIIIG